MSVKEEIKQELEKLIREETILGKLSQEESKLSEFNEKYQNWYTRALKIVKALAPDRLDEFISYYEVDKKRKSFNASTCRIQDYLMDRRGLGSQLHDYIDLDNWNIHEVVANRINNQLYILSSLHTRIDSVLSDVTGMLFAEIQDAELESAKKLLKINIRAAGAVAGVVLERHLQQVAKNHGILIKKKFPTISDLNDPIKKEGVYQTPTWRRIQLFADIRNTCSHQKDVDPNKLEVQELIEGVNSIIKTIF